MVNKEEIMFYGAILFVGSMLVKYTITKCLKSKCSKLLVCWGCLNIERNVDVELLEAQLGIPEEPTDLIPPAILPIIAGTIPGVAPVLSTILPAVTQLIQPHPPRSISPIPSRPLTPLPNQHLAPSRHYNNQPLYSPAPHYPPAPIYYPPPN